MIGEIHARGVSYGYTHVSTGARQSIYGETAGLLLIVLQIIERDWDMNRKALTSEENVAIMGTDNGYRDAKDSDESVWPVGAR